jgi:hypothetical protein
MIQFLYTHSMINIYISCWFSSTFTSAGKSK